MLYFPIMIDWYSVFINSFWIIGLSVLLAGFSYHYWLAKETERSVKEQLNQHSFQTIFWISSILVSIGLAGTSQQWWETAVWILVILMSLLNLYQITKTRGVPPPDGD